MTQATPSRIPILGHPGTRNLQLKYPDHISQGEMPK